MEDQNEDQKDYIVLLEEGAKIQEELKVDHQSRMSRGRKLFKMMFGQKPGVFAFVKDLVYYKGGYPKDTTPPKIEPFLEKVGHFVLMYEALGNLDQINGYMKAKYGVELKVADVGANVYVDGSVKYDEKIEKVWAATFGFQDVPHNRKEVLKMLMEDALVTQKDICCLADQVKITLADKAESEFGIQRGPFCRAVGMKVAENAGKNVDEKLQKIEEKRTDEDKALAPFKDDTTD